MFNNHSEFCKLKYDNGMCPTISYSGQNTEQQSLFYIMKLKLKLEGYNVETKID